MLVTVSIVYLLTCVGLCNPMNCSPPGSFVYEISQARILEWVATSFSGGLPDLGTEPLSLTMQVNSLPLNIMEARFSYTVLLTFFFFFNFLTSVLTTSHREQ